MVLQFNFHRLDFSNNPSLQHPAEDVEISGLLEDYKLIAPEKTTDVVEQSAFFGETTRWRRDTAEGQLAGNWCYGLIQRGNDLEFVLRKEDVPSHFDEEQKITEAFLASIAFFHGQHARPIWMRHRRNGVYALDWVENPRPVARSAHRPFNERIAHNALVGQIDWNFNKSLRCAFNFFVTKTDLVEEMVDLLRQTRDATAGTEHKKINNIVVCALLESAINAIYEARVSPKESPLKIAFDRERDSLVLQLDQQQTNCSDDVGKEALDRLRRRVANVSFEHTRERFRAVVEELGLKWPSEWEDTYAFWAKWRHRVIHRGSRSIAPDDFAVDFKIESRIAGAINLLILRLMDYKGIAIKSIFEDSFTTV
jgi:hypothetical protein